MISRTKRNNYTVDVDPSAGDSVVTKAVVTSWLPFDATISIWHPEIDRLNAVMKSRAERQDEAEFTSNARLFFELTESLGNRAVFNVMLRERRLQVAIRWCAVLLAFGLGALAVVSPLAAICGGVAELLAYLAVGRYVYSARSSALRQFFAFRERSYDERCGEYVSGALAASGFSRIVAD